MEKLMTQKRQYRRRNNTIKKSTKTKLVTIIIVIVLVLIQRWLAYNNSTTMAELPEYSGKAFVTIDHNIPSFTDEDYEKAEKSYIDLSELDTLGRCGPAEMSVTKKDLPTEKRGDISKVRPTGWRQAFYPDLISRNGGALYNRCHLLMYALSGLNDDERNLITGTVYLNIEGMLSNESEILDYVSADNRILYRVTPVFNGTELVARGVHIEVGDVETKGSKFHKNIYCYNVQPGVNISYKTGNSSVGENPDTQDNIELIQELINYFTQN